MVSMLGFGVLPYKAPFNALIKMGIAILVATTTVCLAAYHALVRFSAVGVLLTGQRHASGSRRKFNNGVPSSGNTV